MATAVDHEARARGRALTLRQRQKQELRRDILAIAEALFRERGYAETSTAEIADKVGISRKTLCNYMPTKDAIVVALFEDFVRRHIPDWLESSVPRCHSVDAVVAPRLGERLDVIAAHRSLLEIVFQYTRPSAWHQSDAASQILTANRKARARRIAAVQAEGEIRSDIPAEEISRCYDALRDSVIRQWLLTPHSTRDDLHRAFTNAMSILLRGVSPSALPVAE